MDDMLTFIFNIVNLRCKQPRMQFIVF